MANGHGGRRAGSGRQPKSVRFASKISKADDVFAASLKDAAGKLVELALGGLEVVERRLVPAALVYVEFDEVAEDPRRPGKVKVRRVKRRAYPDLPDDCLVEVERKALVTAPDRAAAIYVINRILGRPKAEADDSAATATPTARDVVAEMQAAASAYVERSRSDPGGAGGVPGGPGPVQ